MKYLIKLQQYTDYEVEVEADSDEEAMVKFQDTPVENWKETYADYEIISFDIIKSN